MGFFDFCYGKDTTALDDSSTSFKTTTSNVTLYKSAFETKYTLTDRRLGEGAFSKVNEAVAKNDTNSSYAVKVITKRNLHRDDIIGLKQEVDILKKLSHHRHIIKMYDFYDDCPDYYYMVTEIMDGGELFDRIVTKDHYNEREARDVCRTLFETVDYIHSHDVVHRDLKPENLLLMSSDNDMDIVIADFGFAKVAREGEKLYTRLGTPGYCAPEIIKGVPYGSKVDCWSLGVIMYILLAGYSPFYSDNMSEMFSQVKRGEFDFPEEDWDVISDDAKELITQLLTVNPTKRISAHDALTSNWIQNDGLESNDLGPNLQQLKKFNAKRKLKQAVLVVMAHNRMARLGNLLKEHNDNISDTTN